MWARARAGGKRWAVAALGGLLVTGSLLQLSRDDDILLTDTFEIVLPVVVGGSLIVTGGRLARTADPHRIARIAGWTVAGTLLGFFINLWFQHIISLEHTPTGEPAVLILNSVAIMMTVGGLLGYYATGHRQRAQEQARVKDRYQTVMELVSDIITVIDDDGTIQYESPAIERVLGYAPDELVGENAFAYIHPEDRDRVWAQFTEMVDQPGSVTANVQYRFKHADGSWMWLETAGTSESHPAVEGYVITSRNVTAQKAYERELERQNERLDSFAEIVSHDLRNPLNVAQGHLEGLRADTDSEALDEIAWALGRMDELIEDVLSLAREGRQLDETEPVALAAVAEQCWASVAATDAELRVSANKRVVADRSRLKQLLENLFRNALDHGGTDVTITVGDVDGGFYVADDGPGIPEAEREVVFERGHSGTVDGTGFGLSIVAEIAKAHDWEVTISDGDAGGARIEFTDVGTPES
jgi:PAS domain S-box-containing protein